MAAKKTQKSADPKKDPTDTDLASRIKAARGADALTSLVSGARTKIPVISSGSLMLNAALGGGYPRGKIIEVLGPEASGKTTLTLQAIAEAQAAGFKAAFIDAEHALDVSYAEALGVKTDELLFAQPDSGEAALDLVETIASEGRGEVAIIVVDSVAALTPKAELEGSMEDAHMGLQARMMGKAMRKLTAVANKNQCTLIFINQLRQKIGIVYGSPITTTGGNALKFYASQRLDVKRKTQLKNKAGEAFGNEVEVTVVKNKVAAPYKSATLHIIWGVGVDATSDLINAALATEVVEQRAGSRFYFKEQQIGHGLAGAIAKLEDDLDLLSEVRNAVTAAMTSE